MVFLTDILARYPFKQETSSKPFFQLIFMWCAANYMFSYIFCMFLFTTRVLSEQVLDFYRANPPGSRTTTTTTTTTTSPREAQGKYCRER